MPLLRPDVWCFDEFTTDADSTASRTGAQTHVGRDDVVEVGRDLDFIVREVIQPRAVPPGCIAQRSGDVAETNGDLFCRRGGHVIVTSKQSQAVSHRSSLSRSDRVGQNARHKDEPPRTGRGSVEIGHRDHEP